MSVEESYKSRVTGFYFLLIYFMDIVSLLIAYQLPAMFLGSFFFGETIILAAAFLAGQGMWSVFTVFWVTFLGTIISDAVWFFAGRRMGALSDSWQKKQAAYKKLLSFLEQMTGRRAFLSLLFIKFLYGTRIISILYLSIHKLRFRTFFVFNAMGTFLWLMVMVGVGWYASKQVGSEIPDMKKFQYGASLLFLFIVLTRAGSVWIRKNMERRA